MTSLESLEVINTWIIYYGSLMAKKLRYALSTNQRKWGRVSHSADEIQSMLEYILNL
jgi:hypothetical protein